jgi:hypothetical protein
MEQQRLQFDTAFPGFSYGTVKAKTEHGFLVQQDWKCISPPSMGVG